MSTNPKGSGISVFVASAITIAIALILYGIGMNGYLACGLAILIWIPMIGWIHTIRERP